MPPMSGRAFLVIRSHFLGVGIGGILRFPSGLDQSQKNEFFGQVFRSAHQALLGQQDLGWSQNNWTKSSKNKELWPCSGTGLLQGTVEIVDSFNPNTGYGFMLCTTSLRSDTVPKIWFRKMSKIPFFLGGLKKFLILPRTTSGFAHENRPYPQKHIACLPGIIFSAAFAGG